MKNQGKIRGGANAYARLHLAVKCSLDEEGALAEGMRERFLLSEAGSDSIKASNGWGIYLQINTRKGFSLVPSIVRWAAAAQRPIAIAHWDGEAACTAEYPSLEFFKAVAEAACFYG